MLPLQTVAEVEKTDDWCKDTIAAIRKIIDARGSVQARRMQLCFNILNGNQDAKDFEYLTGTKDLRLPAKVRFLPVIRPYFDILSSTMESRPLKPEVFAVDSETLEEKNEEVSRILVRQHTQALLDEQQKILQAKQQLDMMREQMSAVSQGQGQGQSPDPRTMLATASADMQLQRMISSFGQDEQVLTERISKWEQEFQYGYQTAREVKCARGLEYLIVKQDLRAKFVEGLRDMYTVDNAIYSIGEIIEGRDPVLRKVNPMDIFHSGESGVRYLRDCSWVAERNYMAPSQIIDEFGESLTEGQVSAIKSRSQYGWGTSDRGRYTGVNGGTVGGEDDCETDAYAGDLADDGAIEVVRCSWMSPRKVYVKEAENRHDPSRPFLKFISDEEVGKGGRKGEKIRSYYVTDRYTGVCIDGNIFVRLGKAPLQWRDVDDYGTAHHPYAGYAYNDSDNQAYSRIWAVKDIQVLYNLIYYQLELLMAMGGIKAFIMDKAQLPKDMSLERFIYNMKQGIIWIDSSRPGASGRPTNFNQFPTVDMTFSNSVAQTLGVLDRLEQLAGRVIGIAPQRMGEIAPGEQVGSSRAAIQQSTLTTEVIFHKMHRVVKQSMDMLLYVMPLAWKEGKRGQYILGQYGQQLFGLDREELGSSRFECFFPDRSNEQQKLDNALQMLSQSGQAQQFSMSQLVGLYDSASIHELEKLLRGYEDLAYRKAQEGEQAKAQHERELAQLDAQTEAQIKTLESGGEKLQAKIEQLRIQQEAQLAQIQAQNRLQVAQTGAQARQYESDQESQVEMAYLEEQRREHDIETHLRVAEIEMNESNGRKDLSSTPRKESVR